MVILNILLSQLVNKTDAWKYYRLQLGLGKFGLENVRVILNIILISDSSSQTLSHQTFMTEDDILTRYSLDNVDIEKQLGYQISSYFKLLIHFQSR